VRNENYFQNRYRCRRSNLIAPTFGLFLNTGAFLGCTHIEVFERTFEEVTLAHWLGRTDHANCSSHRDSPGGELDAFAAMANPQP
jgi:hypothetical protein